MGEVGGGGKWKTDQETNRLEDKEWEGKKWGGGERESMYVHIYGCIVVKLNQLLQRDFHRHSVVKEPSLGQSDQYIYIKKTQRALKF